MSPRPPASLFRRKILNKNVKCSELPGAMAVKTVVTEEFAAKPKGIGPVIRGEYVLCIRVALMAQVCRKKIQMCRQRARRLSCAPQKTFITSCCAKLKLHFQIVDFQNTIVKGPLFH